MTSALVAAAIVFIGAFVATYLVTKRDSKSVSLLLNYVSFGLAKNEESTNFGSRSRKGAASWLDAFIEELDSKLTERRMKLRGRQWLGSLLIAASLMVLIFAVGLRLPFLIALIFAVALTVMGHFALLNRAQGKISKEFQEEFPEALMSISSAIRAGLSFSQGLEASAQQADSELGRQFQRAISDINLGASTEDALQQVANRTKSKDMEWLIDAIVISRETGTSISSVLDTVATSIQERAQLRREVQSLTAEGMLSAYVVVALPFIIFAFLLITQPSYVQIFWTQPIGFAMGGGAIAMIIVGWIWLKSVVKIKE